MAPLQSRDDDEQRDELERNRDPNKTNLIEERARALSYWMEDDWESIMNMYTNDGFYDALLSWIRPTRDFLSFLYAELCRLCVTRVVSVGCGCGFLEWLLRRACTGLEIVGYEVDRGWWQGRYGVKPFIDHVYVDEIGSHYIPEGSVLMTCYFHSWDHWNKYLANFCGDLLIVIGPHSNGHVSFPQPRHILEDRRFVLERQRVIAGGDMIVVVRRNPEVWPRPDPAPEAPIKTTAVVRPPDNKEQQKKQYNEMRRALVLQRIGSAKSSPRPPPIQPIHMGPKLQSTYKTWKPSLVLAIGAVSVSSRLKSISGSPLQTERRSSSAMAGYVPAERPSSVEGGTVKKKRRRKKSAARRESEDGAGADLWGDTKKVSRSEPCLISIGIRRVNLMSSPLPPIQDDEVIRS